MTLLGGAHTQSLDSRGKAGKCTEAAADCSAWTNSGFVNGHVTPLLAVYDSKQVKGLQFVKSQRTQRMMEETLVEESWMVDAETH